MHDDEALMTVAVVDTLWEASIVRGVLEQAGIRALAPEENLVRRREGTTGRVQVLESDRSRAIAEPRRRQIRTIPPHRDA